MVKNLVYLKLIIDTPTLGEAVERANEICRKAEAENKDIYSIKPMKTRDILRKEIYDLLDEKDMMEEDGDE